MGKAESHIVHAILDWFAWNKILAWRNQSGAIKAEGGYYVKLGTKGMPDIIAIHGGHPIGIECKTETGKQSPGQKEFAKKWEDAGGTYIIARSIEDVRSFFEINGFM